MKFCFIGPGFMPIPPVGWGAIESLIYDYKISLEKLNQEIHIINTTNLNEIITRTNDLKPDIVHIMYDDYISIVPNIKCNVILYTSHWAYLDQSEILNKSKYYNIFSKVIDNKNKIYLFALSNKIIDVYTEHGFPKNKIFLAPNGANKDLFYYNSICEFPNKSIYLAKIDKRKSQYKYQSIDNIDFVGNLCDSNFNSKNPNYLGEWDKKTLYASLTKYANLILLSDGEADALVIKEALMAGLGIVISEYAAANLDIDKSFITVIKKEKNNDINYVSDEINKNKIISVNMREQIRSYGLSFDWDILIKKYYDKCCSLLNKSSTIVTCYYKINSKHSHKKYDEWINNFLTNINSNIIIFTSDDLIDYLQNIGKHNKNMMIIKKNFCDLEIHKKYNIWDYQHSIDPQKNIRTKECYIIWNSKMNFVKEAININPFNSDKFVWTDIGCLRDKNFSKNILNYPYYDNISNDKIDITLINDYENLNQEYFFNEIHLSGAIFGASKYVFNEVINLFYFYFDDYIKKNKFIGCDQQILSTLYIKHKNLFNLIKPTENIIDKWFYLWYHYVKK